MIRRILLLTGLLSCFWLTAWGNQEFTVNLDKGDNSIQTVDLDYARVTFEFVTSYSNVARVRVLVEDIDTSLAILLFKYGQDERALKSHKPKFDFAKKYPGGKGHRFVTGCRDLPDYFQSIVPAETDTLFTVNASTTATVRLRLPMYLAKFKPKNLHKSGKYHINYTILEEDIVDFDINVKAWSETDPTYVQTRNAVSDFISSLDGISFCPNRKHSPSLAQQQKPYLEKKDSLVSVISGILRNSDWMSTDEPHRAYSSLLKQLNDVNLNSFNKDCGAHRGGGRVHSCSYCGLSAQQVYHQLDDLYQQLRAGHVSKNAAVKKARALYNCYQNSTKRKKDSFYTGKISGFYNRIVK